MNDARPRIAIIDWDGRAVAAAQIDAADASTVRASLRVEAGHLPTGVREQLVDAVLADPEVHVCEHVQVAVPLGDTEILDRIRERCEIHDTHAAGVTCLLDVTPPDPGRPSRA
jgi:hypothetical protein